MSESFQESPSSMPRFLMGALVLAGVVAAGAASVASASESRSQKTNAPSLSLTAQNDQIAAGAQVFQQVCSRCHGEAGTGGGPDGDGPPLVGPRSAAADYRNGNRLFDFLSTSMPDDDPGSLSAQQYYDVIAFLMDRNGWNASRQIVDASTAETIPLQ